MTQQRPVLEAESAPGSLAGERGLDDAAVLLNLTLWATASRGRLKTAVRRIGWRYRLHELLLLLPGASELL